MFDDLREQTGDSEFDEEELIGLEDEEEEENSFQSSIAQRARGLDLSFGMTPGQRAILSVLLMMTICVLSTLCLLVTERVGF